MVRRRPNETHPLEAGPVSSYYGVIFPEFWTGTTGRQLRECGKDAQLLGLYLATNRHANMIGLYRLLVEDIRHETGIGAKGIGRAFEATEQTQYARFDFKTSYVWVRQMARIRLGLQPGEHIASNDNKVKAVNRLYQAIDPNPFLGDFFDANHKILALRKRREPVGVVVAFDPHHQMSGLQGAYLAPSKPGTGIRIRKQVQEVQKQPGLRPRHSQPVENPKKNIGVITKLAHEALDLAGKDADDGDIRDAIKSLCAMRSIDYDSAVVNRAVDSARAQREARS